MGLYNVLFGTNHLAPVLLAILDLDQADGNWASGRFRDIEVNKDGSRIILYTRNGGGNRDHYDEEIAEGESCRCTGCIITCHLPKHPNYVRDYDDDYDSTYAYVEFTVPHEWAESVKALATGQEPATIHERFSTEIQAMESMSAEELQAEPRYAPVVELMGKIAETLKAGSTTGGRDGSD